MHTTLNPAHLHTEYALGNNIRSYKQKEKKTKEVENVETFIFFYCLLGEQVVCIS